MEIHFAPLQGYTDDCYRRAHHQLLGGIDCYYTPFVRLEHGAAREKDLRDVRPDFNEGVPVVPQVIARDGQELSALIEVLRPMGYTRLDINMGCPFTLQTRHGRGAGLLPNPEAVEDICRIVQQHEGELTFSVKMRLGLHEVDEWQRVLPILNDTPLVHICLHPRTADEGYKGAIHLDEFARFAHLCDHPLLYNGDLRTPADIEHIAEQYPFLKGVMIGRGLLARPSLALEFCEGQEHSEREQTRHLLTLHRALLADYAQFIPSESQLHQKLRPFWDYAEATIGRKAWKKIHKAGSMRNYLLAIQELG
ncbi:MAG: tRNA-dihydrouridine synthase family protein [Bacteroidales bacterium]|nr:tRNA-dihydrouridine synthase family protein [Bacteroidales bacterium]